MTWKWIAGVSLTMALVMGFALTTRMKRTEAAEPGAAKKHAAEKPAAAEKPHRATKAETASELTAIIRETKSPEVFVVSLTALIALDPKDRSVLPLAIRKADELGILKNAMGDGQKPPLQESFMDLVEVLLGDALNQISPKSQRSCTQQYAPVTPDALCPAPSYSLPTSMPAPVYPPPPAPAPRRTMPPAQVGAFSM